MRDPERTVFQEAWSRFKAQQNQGVEDEMGDAEETRQVGAGPPSSLDSGHGWRASLE